MEHSLNAYITIIPPVCFHQGYVQAKLAEVSFLVQCIYIYIYIYIYIVEEGLDGHGLL